MGAAQRTYRCLECELEYERDAAGSLMELDC